MGHQPEDGRALGRFVCEEALDRDERPGRVFLERHVALAGPALLVVVGGTAASALLDRPEGITRLRGRWFAFERPTLPAPIPVLATFHPAYLLRSPGAKRESWRDLLALRQRMDELGL